MYLRSVFKTCMGHSKCYRYPGSSKIEILPLLVERSNCASAPVWVMIGNALVNLPDDVEYRTLTAPSFGTVTLILPDVACAAKCSGTMTLVTSILPEALLALTLPKAPESSCLPDVVCVRILCDCVPRASMRPDVVRKYISSAWVPETSILPDTVDAFRTLDVISASSILPDTVDVFRIPDVISTSSILPEVVSAVKSLAWILLASMRPDTVLWKNSQNFR